MIRKEFLSFPWTQKKKEEKECATLKSNFGYIHFRMNAIFILKKFEGLLEGFQQEKRKEFPVKENMSVRFKMHSHYELEKTPSFLFSPLEGGN